MANGKLTDKQIKHIIADYAETENLSETARRNNVSDTTVKRYVSSNKEVLELMEQKKEQNTKSVLAFMDAKKNDACSLIEKIMNAMNDPDKIKATSLSQLATTMGIIIDKYTMNDKASNKTGKIVLEIHRRNDEKQD